MKPYYEHAGIRIYNGDCRAVIASFPQCFRLDALVTDPPYGIGFADYASHDDSPSTYKALLHAAVSAAEAHITDGWCAVYQSATTATQWHDLLPREWRPIAMPKTFTQVHPGQWPLAATDYVLLWRIGTPEWPTKGDRVRDWLVQETSDMSLRPKGHPCPRPLSGTLHVVRASAPPDGTVIDPFMGSGTTLVAAKNLGRKAIGIEIEERYCEIAAKRLSQEVLPLVST